MKDERIKELQNFANNFNNRLNSIDLELKDNEIFKKMNKNSIQSIRNKISEFNSISNSPTRSKSQFRPVI